MKYLWIYEPCSGIIVFWYQSTVQMDTSLALELSHDVSDIIESSQNMGMYISLKTI